jgi:hypothetical protein
MQSKQLIVLIVCTLSFLFFGNVSFQNHEMNAFMEKRRIEAVTPQKLRYMYINKSGNIVIDASRFDEARGFSEGLAAVAINGMHGYIDRSGQIVIPIGFGDVGDFSEGLAAAAEISEYGYIDKKGDWQIKPKYDYAADFSEGLAIVFMGDNYFYVDRSGQTVLRPRSALQGGEVAGSNFSEGLAKILVGDRLGFMDKSGTIAITPRFTAASKFSQGLARVELVGGKLGYIDRHGRFVIKPIFNTDADFDRNSTDFSEGWASLTEGLKPGQTPGRSKWVYIDKAGKVVLRTEYFYAGSFKDGLASVYDDKSGKSGFIDKNGRVTIPIVYDRASEFSEGLACVAVVY